jgi:hypothetical protein
MTNAIKPLAHSEPASIHYRGQQMIKERIGGRQRGISNLIGDIEAAANPIGFLLPIQLIGNVSHDHKEIFVFPVLAVSNLRRDRANRIRIDCRRAPTTTDATAVRKQAKYCGARAGSPCPVRDRSPLWGCGRRFGTDRALTVKSTRRPEKTR